MLPAHYNDKNIMSTDTSRISISAHYTGYVWYKNGLSDPRFVTPMGRAANLLFTPVNAILNTLAGAHIDTFLLQRHVVLDYLLAQLIEDEGVEQVVELASGLSPRGYRITERYPQVSYLETDLPDMAAHKATLLNRLRRPARHSIRSCNILDENGPDSLKTVLASLDSSKKTVIISEGLVNYFPLPVIREVWGRLANELKRFTGGYYLTDLYPNLTTHPSYRYVKMAQKLVGVLTRGQWPLHYNGDADIEAGFKQDGFLQVDVVNPEDIYSLLNLPKPKRQSLVRIVKAKV